MRDTECVAFLQWALPQMRMRWAGFRRVRRQVCKRIARRLDELDLEDLDGYRGLLEADPGEWERLDALCRITISRFYRDRAVWTALAEDLLPELATLAGRRGDGELRCWSVGCASGEEPLSLALVWRRGPGATARIPLRILATDADDRLLGRARAGVYAASSVRELPGELRDGFTRRGDRYHIDPSYGEPIAFVRQDVRRELPQGEFHLVLCRNLVFTYYDEPLQRSLLARVTSRLVPGGVLVVGMHETLPPHDTPLSALEGRRGFYRRNEDEEPANR